MEATVGSSITIATTSSYLPFCHPTRFLPLRSNPLSTFRSIKHFSFQNPKFSSIIDENSRFHTFSRCSTRASMSSLTESTGTKPYSVLFVCLGNICRSPAAEGVFRDIVTKKGLDSKFNIDSAGTIDYHEGNLADSRMRAAAKKRGIQITSTSRPIRASDFRDFDLILAMDEQNREDILKAFNVWKVRENVPSDGDKKVKLMCSYCKKHDDSEVPDPYYGGAQGFEKVLDLLEDACDSLLESILAKTSS